MKIVVLATACVTAYFVVLSVGATAESGHSYSGMQSRIIKALSEQQVADLKAGRGMGLALAAELNGYPGPSHLLELADQINLSVEQRLIVKKSFDAMKAETITIGERLLVQETQLDRLFAEQSVSEQNLKVSMASIGQTQSELRNAHLKYHLQTRLILTADQIKHYAKLRGYDGEHRGSPHHNHQ